MNARWGEGSKASSLDPSIRFILQDYLVIHVRASPRMLGDHLLSLCFSTLQFYPASDVVYIVFILWYWLRASIQCLQTIFCNEFLYWAEVYRQERHLHPVL